VPTHTSTGEHRLIVVGFAALVTQAQFNKELIPVIAYIALLFAQMAKCTPQDTRTGRLQIPQNPPLKSVMTKPFAVLPKAT
jgi:hypothetical protein